MCGRLASPPLPDPLSGAPRATLQRATFFCFAKKKLTKEKGPCEQRAGFPLAGCDRPRVWAGRRYRRACFRLRGQIPTDVGPLLRPPASPPLCCPCGVNLGRRLELGGSQTRTICFAATCSSTLASTSPNSSLRPRQPRGDLPSLGPSGHPLPQGARGNESPGTSRHSHYLIGIIRCW
jgi:hypothetical protein